MASELPLSYVDRLIGDIAVFSGGPPVVWQIRSVEHQNTGSPRG